MRDILFGLETTLQTGLQAQLREKLVSAIVGGQLPAGTRLPSSRHLAADLGISRNTVTLAYQSLIDDGFLLARERSGYFVADSVPEPAQPERPPPAGRRVAWQGRFRIRPSGQRNIAKPENWPDYEFPFIYGQVDHKHFPVAEWRDCARRAMGRQWFDAWTSDHHTKDDPALVEQMRTRLLPRRGIMANEDEILITMGAQHALYLLASLLVRPDTAVGLEDPGYPDVRNIFRLRSERVRPIPVDEEGLVVGPDLAACDLVYVTPSHQVPTTVTMTERRRTQLLERAAADDLLIIEDDYEAETNFVSAPSPALKSLDREGRVIYVGSLSKTLFPGLRLGYLVGDPELIREARALRRLMLRHPPYFSQRTTALFLALGHHDALNMRLRRVYDRRWQEMGRALERHLPDTRRPRALGGSSVWIEGPAGLDANRLAADALAAGIILEPGGVYFAQTPAPRHCFRLGFSSIEAEKIAPGIERIAGLIAAQLADGAPARGAAA